MTAVLRPVQRWANAPAGFNRAAAETVYKAMMALPDDDSAAIYGRIIVDGLLQHTLITQAAEIAKAFSKQEARNCARLRANLSRTAVAKARTGADSSAELRGLAVLSKAMDFTDEQRRQWASQQQRELATGRFARNHVAITYDENMRPLSQNHAKQFGIPVTGGGTGKNKKDALSGADLARYQQAYGQLHDMLSDFTGMGSNALAHLYIGDTSSGELKPVTMKVPARGEENGLKNHLSDGQYLHSASVSVVPPVTAAGAAYDAMAGIGLPGAGGAAYNTMAYGAGNTNRLNEYRTALDARTVQDPYIPSERIFRNIASSSTLLRDSLGDVAPRKVQYALAVGEHVGKYGPEAQKVIGPTADKAAYRYRGTEKPLGLDLAEALRQVSHEQGNAAQKREYMLHGEGQPPNWTPSPVLNEFRRELPKTRLNSLQLKSGVVPPSRGIVLDRNGNTMVEAVGYGDDHYLPFNLKGRSFRSLKGGEYIRTRTFGGPTTEDIYAGLMSGAKGLTVVSHNGVYTIDLNDSLKGGRRFNDAAARMVGRYGHLLDAVQSEQVETGGIDQSRLDEIATEVNDVIPQEHYPAEYKKEFNRRRAAEKENPVLSHQQRTLATLAFLNDHAASLAGADRDGNRNAVLNPDTLVNDYIATEAKSRWAAEGQRIAGWNKHAPELQQRPVPLLEDYEAEVRAEISDDDPVKMGAKVAEKLQISRGLAAALAEAEQENRIAVSPLKLNGIGYKTALDALQEQFPHYIDRVRFHPWTTEQGPEDSGYVRPKHNRPMKAMAGYFDTGRDGNGPGKVWADTIRWQNRRRAEPVKVQFKTKAEQEQEAEVGVPRQAAPTELSTADAQAAADLALFTAYNSATHIGANPRTAYYAGGSLEGHKAANRPLDGVAEAKEFKAIAPNLAQVLTMDPEEFKKQYAEARAPMQTLLTGAAQENQKYRYVDDVGPLEEAFKRGGKPVPLVETSEHISDLLDHYGEDVNWPDAPPAFLASMRPKAEQVQKTYAAIPTIDRLVKTKELPAEVGAEDFKAKADLLHTRLTGRRDELKSRITREGLIPTPLQWAAIDKPSEGLLRAVQLRHRHDEALKAASEAAADAAAAAAALAPQVTNSVSVIGVPAEGESMAEYHERANRAAAMAAAAEREIRETREARAGRGPFDNGNVIES